MTGQEMGTQCQPQPQKQMQARAATPQRMLLNLMQAGLLLRMALPCRNDSKEAAERAGKTQLNSLHCRGCTASEL